MSSSSMAPSRGKGTFSTDPSPTGRTKATDTSVSSDSERPVLSWSPTLPSTPWADCGLIFTPYVSLISTVPILGGTTFTSRTSGVEERTGNCSKIWGCPFQAGTPASLLIACCTLWYVIALFYYITTLSLLIVCTRNIFTRKNKLLIPFLDKSKVSLGWVECPRCVVGKLRIIFYWKCKWKYCIVIDQSCASICKVTRKINYFKWVHPCAIWLIHQGGQPLFICLIYGSRYFSFYQVKKVTHFHNRFFIIKIKIKSWIIFILNWIVHCSVTEDS